MGTTKGSSWLWTLVTKGNFSLSLSFLCLLLSFLFSLSLSFSFSPSVGVWKRFIINEQYYSLTCSSHLDLDFLLKNYSSSHDTYNTLFWRGTWHEGQHQKRLSEKDSHPWHDSFRDVHTYIIQVARQFQRFLQLCRTTVSEMFTPDTVSFHAREEKLTDAEHWSRPVSISFLWQNELTFWRTKSKKISHSHFSYLWTQNIYIVEHKSSCTHAQII